MDIEQLKLVLETIQSLGHDAGQTATMWVWLYFGSKVLSNGFLVAAVAVIAYAIYRVVALVQGNENATYFLKDMREVLGTGSSGYLTDPERERTQQLLRNLAEEYAAKKRAK